MLKVNLTSVIHKCTVCIDSNNGKPFFIPPVCGGGGQKFDTAVGKLENVKVVILGLSKDKERGYLSFWSLLVLFG